MATETQSIDWVKVICVTGCVAQGVHRVFKLYREWRTGVRVREQKIQEVEGLTVKNGAYKEMRETNQAMTRSLGRIEKRIDLLRDDHKAYRAETAVRFEAIENRLST